MLNHSEELFDLYKKPFPSTRTGALFNAFSYPTKISPESEALFIACHSKVGDVILDPFGGSGTTGVATMLCDQPSETLLSLAKEYGLHPQWGPRKAYVYEISTLGSMLGKVMCHTEHKVFEQEAKKLLDYCEALAEELYSTKDDKGKRGTLRYTIWSDVLICPHCGEEIRFADVAVNQEPLSFSDEGKCPHCHQQIKIAEAHKATVEVYDPVLNRTISTKKRVPYKIYGTTDKRKWSRMATEEDLSDYAEKENTFDYSDIPCRPIKWGELYRQGYHYGITHLHHFYTRRNAVMFSKLWARVKDCDHKLQEALRIFLLSYNSSHSTLMTRVVAKKNNKDFVLTGAQPGVLYISSLPVEKNIQTGLRRKLKTFVEAFSILDKSNSEVHFINESCTDMDTMANHSIDYVFTDPPFGDFIPYSEINQINECWLGNVTNDNDEVIINHSQGKELKDYERLMDRVFGNISSKLKPSGKCTLVFHSAKADIWRAIISAYGKAGLNVCTASILDKVQNTFKQTNSNVTVKGDPIILLEKTMARTKKSKYKNDLEVAKSLLFEVSNVEIDKAVSTKLFSNYIRICVENELKITLDAKYFFQDDKGK